ncbi:MAG: hypothetical protein FJW34_04160 [Acidobacteria bacterium]|nr:hypothetical protein [Acidobacteriota bacterium]MBM4042973.1 hypothetical protein [Planctomycetota bacterium]
MLWTLIGLGIPTVVSVEGAVSSNKSSRVKVSLILVALFGFYIATSSAFVEQRQKREAQERARELRDKVDAANMQLEQQGQVLKLVSLTVGDLGMLNRLSGGEKYFVRIAADTSEKRLKAYLSDIERKFSGASSSGLLSVRPPTAGSRNYELVFGSQLDVAAAEVFHRLANSHRFPPDRQIAEIRREPSSKR